MELELGGWAGGGRVVGRAEERVWFVAGALPGERIEVEVERRRAGVVEARAVRVVSPSALREADPCPAAVECGGCDLAHLRRARAAEALREIVVGALRHAPRQLGDAVRDARVVLSPMGWRMRARLHWDPDRRRLGFLAARSHRVADISPCRICSPLLLGALPTLTGALADARLRAGELEWMETLDATRAVAGWGGPGAPPRVEIRGLAGWHPLDAEGAALTGGWGDESVVVELPVPLRVPVGAFFQGNRFLVPALFTRVGELVVVAGARRVVDLYGGVGLLAAAAHHVGVADATLVESSPVASAAARDNLPGATIVAATAESFLVEPGEAEGTVAIVDPPRVGLSLPASAALVRWAPSSVLLIGCDAARFGRDAGALLAASYSLAALEIWDLFAGSHHAEIVALFRR